MKSDIEIAREAKIRPITAVAEGLGVPEEALHPYGRHVAKIDPAFIEKLQQRSDGRLICSIGTIWA